MLTSSSSFALIGHSSFIILFYYYFNLFYYYLFFILFEFNLTVVRGRRSREGRMKTEEKTQVSEVGFEPGTFRSCVAHFIHYATETPPIPDVLLVLVAPKYINRNVTTTLQSRFTPTPTPRTNPYCSPKFGLYRFVNIFLQNPYLLTWRIWRKNGFFP